MQQLKRAVPTVSIADAQLLDDYDSYYYSRGRQTPLPILRVKFNDPDRTWVYIDPELSQVVARIHRFDRVERWLDNGLHSLDFSFLYQRRPLWDIVMLALLAGGLASSTIGGSCWVSGEHGVRPEARPSLRRSRCRRFILRA